MKEAPEIYAKYRPSSFLSSSSSSSSSASFPSSSAAFPCNNTTSTHTTTTHTHPTTHDTSHTTCKSLKGNNTTNTITKGTSRSNGTTTTTTTHNATTTTTKTSKKKVEATQQKVCWRVVTDTKHPACGQLGLFTRNNIHLHNKEHITDYYGRVTLAGRESTTSDYTASFGDENELVIDAEQMGCEGRMVNDYRNTGMPMNAAFEQYRDDVGDLQLCIIVSSKHGIPPGREVLVSYGKGFWEKRVREMGFEDMAAFREFSFSSSSSASSASSPSAALTK